MGDGHNETAVCAGVLNNTNSGGGRGGDVHANTVLPEPVEKHERMSNLSAIPKEDLAEMAKSSSCIIK